jgi:hypothetical protein
MEGIDLQIDSKAFNLIWCSLHDREKTLLKIIEEYDEESDEATDALNDLAYLRIYKSGLKEMAEKSFHQNAFIIDDIPLKAGALKLV